jgi:hypothetical protein
MKHKPDWRENADILRKRMMDATIEGLKKEMETFEGAKLTQIAETMPVPPPGHQLELKVSTAGCAASLSRSEGWYSVAYMDLRGLSPEFVEAYLECLYRDNSDSLRDYLKSGKSLGPKEREKLARLLPKSKKGGRPRNNQLRGASELAWIFYRRLQQMNKASGIAVRGQSDDMKLYAARAMVSDYFSHLESLSEEEQERFAMQVREFMDKSRARRSGSEKAVISVRAPGLDDRQKS